MAGWERAARAVLGQFRAAAGQYPGDPRFAVRRRLAAAAALRGARAGAWLDAAPFGPKAAARGSDQVY
jgi:hypothetical protein